MVGRDVFCRRVDMLCHGTGRCIGPELRPQIIGAPAQHQVKTLARRCQNGVPSGRSAIGHGPVAVGGASPSEDCWIMPSSETCSTIVSVLTGEPPRRTDAPFCSPSLACVLSMRQLLPPSLLATAEGLKELHSVLARSIDRAHARTGAAALGLSWRGVQEQGRRPPPRLVAGGVGGFIAPN